MKDKMNSMKGCDGKMSREKMQKMEDKKQNSHALSQERMSGTKTVGGNAQKGP